MDTSWDLGTTKSIDHNDSLSGYSSLDCFKGYQVVSPDLPDGRTLSPTGNLCDSEPFNSAFFYCGKLSREADVFLGGTAEGFTNGISQTWDDPRKLAADLAASAGLILALSGPSWIRMPATVVGIVGTARFGMELTEGLGHTVPLVSDTWINPDHAEQNKMAAERYLAPLLLDGILMSAAGYGALRLSRGLHATELSRALSQLLNGTNSAIDALGAKMAPLFAQVEFAGAWSSGATSISVDAVLGRPSVLSQPGTDTGAGATRKEDALEHDGPGNATVSLSQSRPSEARGIVTSRDISSLGQADLRLKELPEAMRRELSQLEPWMQQAAVDAWSQTKVQHPGADSLTREKLFRTTFASLCNLGKEAYLREAGSPKIRVSSNGSITSISPELFRRQFGVEYTTNLLFDNSDFTPTPATMETELPEPSQRTLERYHQALLAGTLNMRADAATTWLYQHAVRSGYTADLYIGKVNDLVGHGIFAASDIEPGELIAEYTGRVVNPKPDEGLDHRYLFNYPGTESGYVDARLSGNYTRFINHSAHHRNARAVSVYIDSAWHVLLVASKPILKGEQVLINYGHGYWKNQAQPAEL